MPSEVGFAAPLSLWFSRVLQPFISFSNLKSDLSSSLSGDRLFDSLRSPDYSSKSIWEVIQTDEHLGDLKRVLKYSGSATRELLDDKEKKLTFLGRLVINIAEVSNQISAPVNWHHHGQERGYEDVVQFSMAQWNVIDHQIRFFEKSESVSILDDDRERKRKVLASIIDAHIKYHIVGADRPLRAWEISQNSSVATTLTIGNGKARKVLGNLLDGQAFRLRVGKSLLPKPSAYFNFYSRLVFPDVQASGSLIHAISFPLIIPPSTLQTLFFSEPYFGGLTSALQKVQVAKYLSYPFNRSAIHERGENDVVSIPTELFMEQPSLIQARTSNGGEYHSPKHAHGLTGVTVFAPANLAWARIPSALRLYLFSPFGKNLLQKVLGLHSLPYTIFYADFVHEGNSEKPRLQNHYSDSASNLLSTGNWPFSIDANDPAPLGSVNVSRYTFTTACPKLHHNRTEGYYFSQGDFETIDVEVYRYYILPGNKGPLQTRVSVQGIPVVLQDIPAGNGALHQIERLIMPKGHPHRGTWADVAKQAHIHGFGDVDASTIV